MLKYKERINHRFFDLQDRLRIIENELFVENYFYAYPDSEGTKKLLRRDALIFSKVYKNYWSKGIATLYTNEADYENFKVLIDQWEKEAIEWEKKHKK